MLGALDPVNILILCLLVGTGSAAGSLDQVLKDFESNFTTDFGSWAQLKTDNFEWSRQTGSTPTANTGPDKDSQGSAAGYYAYIEVNGQAPNSTASLRFTSAVNTKETLCLRFFYHMYGANIGMLNLLQNGAIIFTRKGNQENKWHEARLEVTGAMNFTIEGSQGPANDDTGDIAIDDLSLSRYTCYNNVSIEKSAYSLAEDAGFISVKLLSSRSMSASFSRQFRLRTMDLSASSSQDYTLVDKTVTFPQNQTEMTYNITIVKDALVEDNEDFQVQISELSPWPGAKVVAVSKANITILNDDKGEIGFKERVITVKEGGPSANICVVLRSAKNVDFKVNVTTDPSTATFNKDYRKTIAAEMTFTAGSGMVTKCAEIPIIKDDLVEGDEKLTVRLAFDPKFLRLNSSAANVTVIIKDNNKAKLSFEKANYNTTEGGIISVVITNSGTNTIPLDFRIQSIDHTATSTGASKDFDPINEVKTFKPNTTKMICNLTTIKDDRLELDEIFFLNLTSLTDNAIVGSVKEANITIINDDSVSVSIDKASYDVSEEAGKVVISVTLTGKTEIPVSVSLSTANNTAFATHDFMGKTKEILTFPATSDSSTTKNVTIKLNNESLVEKMENFTVSMTTSQRDVKVLRNRTIVNIANDDQVVIGFTNTSITVSETSAFYTVCLTKKGKSAIDVTVTLSAANKTAYSNKDFVPLDPPLFPVVFPANAESVCKNFSLIRDKMVEDLKEMFLISLKGDPGRANIDEKRKEMTVFIQDDDKAELTIAGTEYVVKENAKYVTITINSTANNDIPLPFSVNTIDLSANSTGRRDFTALSENATFLPGVKQMMFNVSLNDDGVLENDERFTVRLMSQTDKATVTPNSLANVTIIDGDTVSVSFDKASFNVSEQAGEVVISVTLTGKTDIPVSVSLSTANNTAFAMHDFMGKTKEIVTFPATSASSTTKNVTIKLNNESLVEKMETFTVSMTTSQRDVKVERNQTIVNIANDDQVVIGFTNKSITVSEKNAFYTVCMTKKGKSAIDVIVKLSTMNKTAHSTKDFVPLDPPSFSVVFPANAESVCQNLTLTRDNMVEDTEEKFYILLEGDPERVEIDQTRKQMTIYIQDDDKAELTIAGTEYVVKENAKYVTITINSTANNDIPLPFSVNTFDLSANSTDRRDFNALTENATFLPGVKQMMFNVSLNDDGVLENDEKFQVRLMSQTKQATVTPNSLANVTIIDVDTVSVTLLSETIDVDEGNAGAAKVGVRKTGKSDIPVRVTLSTMNGTATPGKDFVEINNEVVEFPPGPDAEVTIYVKLNITADVLVERHEDFTVHLDTQQRGVVIKRNVSKVVIKNDDKVTIAFRNTSLSIAEDGGYIRPCLYKTGHPTADVHVRLMTADGTASAQRDYEALNISVTFAVNETLKCFQLAIKDDDVTEHDEMFSLGLSNQDQGVQLGNNRLDVTIRNNDYVVVDFIGDVSRLAKEGDKVNVTVGVVKGKLGIPITVKILVNKDKVTATSEKEDFIVSDSIVLTPESPTNSTMVTIKNDNDTDSDDVIQLTLASTDASLARVGKKQEFKIRIDDTADIEAEKERLRKEKEDEKERLRKEKEEQEDRDEELQALLIAAVVIAGLTIIIVLIALIVVAKKVL